jgi:hypothetical protein
VWTVLTGLAATTAAWAQSEQWLQYHTSREGRGYHWLELSTNRPPNVALPKLNAAPWFARWATPLDPKGGRWLCFDRTRKSGPHDRVYFDRNGNGRLDDDSPVNAARRDQYAAYFDPLRLVFKGEDGPITYHLGLQVMKYDDEDVRALAQSAGWYEGMVTVAGKKRRLQLIDANVNGVFNDLAANPSDCDRIMVGEDKENVNERMGERALGRLLELGGQLFAIEVARDGAFVKIKKAESVTLGSVRVPETLSELTAVGENGQFERKPAKGEFTLPAGKYRVHHWSTDRKDGKGVAWKLSGYIYSEAAEFDATADKPFKLDVGEPLHAALQASESKGTVSFSLHLQGQFGESVEIMRGSQRPRAPQLSLASRDGLFRCTNTFEYG